jgi:hypothetical protein
MADRFGGIALGEEERDRFGGVAPPIERSPGEKFLGGMEVGKTMVGSALTEVVAGYAGTVAQMMPGGMEGGDVVKTIRDLAAPHLEPQTVAGREYMETIAGHPAVQWAGEKMEQAGDFLGNTMMDATNNPTLAAGAKAIPEGLASLTGGGAAAGSIRGGKRMAEGVRNMRGRGEQTRHSLMDGDNVNDNVGKMLTTTGRVVPDPQAKMMVNQGWRPEFIGTLNQANQKTRNKIMHMFNIMKKGNKNEVYQVRNRPSSIVGESLEERLQFLNNVKNGARKDLSRIVKNELKGKPVDIKPAIDAFEARLVDDLKMTITKDGDYNVHYFGSALRDSKGAQEVIGNFVRNMKEGGEVDAFRVHHLKLYLDETLSMGKRGKSPTGKPVSDKAMAVMGQLRHDLNIAIQQAHEPYKVANTTIHETMGAMEPAMKLAGKDFKFTDTLSSQKLGVIMRTIRSNYKSGGEMLEMVDNVEDIAVKYGGKFEDDIVIQRMVADEFERMFKAEGAQSLRGIMDQSADKAIDAATGQMTATGAVATGAKALYRKTRGLNQENQIKAMEDWLKSRM